MGADRLLTTTLDGLFQDICPSPALREPIAKLLRDYPPLQQCVDMLIMTETRNTIELDHMKNHYLKVFARALTDSLCRTFGFSQDRYNHARAVAHVSTEKGTDIYSEVSAITEINRSDPFYKRRIRLRLIDHLLHACHIFDPTAPCDIPQTRASP